MAGAFTWLLLTRPDSTLFVGELVLFGIISWKKPLWGLIILLSLPLAGEFSRMDFAGRNIVVNDLLVPVFGLASLLHFTTIGKSQNPLLDTSLPLRPVLVFLAVAVFSLLFSLTVIPPLEVFQSGLYLIRLTSYLLLLPITYLIIDRPNSRHFIWTVAIISLLLAVGGFIQLQLLPDLEGLAKSAGYDPHLNRLVGTWLDPNFIGGFFAFISMFLISVAIYTKSRSERVVFSVITAVLLTALFLTYSRSAYLAFAVGIVLLGLLRARKLLIIVLIVGGIGLASSDRAQQRVGEMVTSFSSVLFNTSENPDPTARLRLQNWEQTWQLIGQKPWLGHGYNTLAYVKLSEGFVSDESIHSASGSDSSLLTILATTGIIGLLVFIWFYFRLLKDSLFSWLDPSTAKDPLLKGLCLGMFTGLIVLLLHSNFVNSLLFPQIMTFLFPLLGTFYRLRLINNKSPSPRTAVHRSRS